jgi:hypothetical protein
MSEGILTWSQDPASNSNASSAVAWPEGQSPKTVNDSSRSMMAEIARYRDDLAGVTPPDGVITSTGAVDGTTQLLNAPDNEGNHAISPAVLTNGWEITWVAGFTNTTGPVTFSIDATAPKPLRCAKGVEMKGGEIIAGQIYTCVYHKTDDEWLMKSSGGVQIPSSAVATVAEIRAGIADKLIAVPQFWGTPFPVALPDAAAAANVNIDFSTGLNFTLNLTGNLAKLNTITGGKPGQAGVIEITAVGTAYDLTKSGSWLGVISDFPLHIAAGKTAHLFYSIRPTNPLVAIVTGIINNPG